MSSPRGISSAASTAASTDSYQDAVVQVRPSKLFVGGLTQNTSTKLLREHFLQFGQVLDCIAMRHPDGKARGFGYVTLDTLEGACRCVDEPQRIDGRVVDVKHAVPGHSRTKEAAALKASAAQKAGAAKKAGAAAQKAPAAQKTPASQKAAAQKAAPVTVHMVCPECAKCEKCRSDCRSEWRAPREPPSGGAWRSGWRDSWAPPAATWNSSMWNGAWGLEQLQTASSAQQAAFLTPVAPPPGLPMPHGMSIFRTPSPSECSSSRASSPERECVLI